MAISSKNLSIIVFSSLIIIVALSSYYIYQTFSVGSTINQQVDPYGRNIATSDKIALSNFTGTLYPLFKSLDDIMSSVIARKSNSNLYNMSSSLIDQAKKIDSGKKGLDDPYGLPKGIDNQKRVILDQIMDEFSAKNPGKDLVYTFIATEDCNMYIMEHYSSQKTLRTGVYPDHPWCIEFYDKKDRSAEYLTEFYYAKARFSKVSSVVFPLHANDGNISFYVGGTLDMYRFTQEFFKQYNLGEWPKTQILLLVTRLDDGSKTLFDPISTATRGDVQYKGVNVAKYENNSFTADDQREIIKNIQLFDNGNGVARPVATSNGTYSITATTNLLPNSYEIANPLQNHSHLVEWEWIIMRNVPDTQSTINYLVGVLDYYQILNNLILALVLISVIGLGATIVLYKKVKKIGRGW